MSGTVGRDQVSWWRRECFEETERGALMLEWCTDLHEPKMRVATAPTTSQTPTPAVAPAASVAVPISTSPSALEDAVTTTCSAAQAAVNAWSRAGVGAVVGLNLRHAVVLPVEVGREGVGWRGHA